MLQTPTVVYLLILTSTHKHNRNETQEVFTDKVKARKRITGIMEKWLQEDPNLEKIGTVASDNFSVKMGETVHNIVLTRIDDAMDVANLWRWWQWRDYEETEEEKT